MAALRCVICALVFAGCVESEVVEPDELVPDDTVFHEISVDVGPDGIVVSEPRPITAGEERAQNAMKEAMAAGAAAIALDGYCLGNSFWYYDRDDFTGNRICFQGAGDLALVEYIRIRFGMVMSWELSRGSLWAGDREGIVRGTESFVSRENCALNLGGICVYEKPWCNRLLGVCWLSFEPYEKQRFDLTANLKILLLE